MKLSFLIAALVLAGLLPSASAATVVMEEKAAAKRVAGVVQQPSSEDFIRLSITPRNKQLKLKPGEEREFKVRVGNEGEEGVVLEPGLVVSPYGQYIMKEGWVSVTSEEAEAGPEEEQEFKVKVKVPEDAQVAFTNETLPHRRAQGCERPPPEPQSLEGAHCENLTQLHPRQDRGGREPHLRD